MNEEKLKEAQDFYNDRIKGWMIPDLKKSINASTNFLTALGCFVYTEIIGNFLPQLGEKEVGSKNEKKFYWCLFRMKNAKYMKQLDDFLRKETNKGIYSQMRHNLCHRYYPAPMKNKDGVIFFFKTVVARDGFKVEHPKKVRCASLFFDDQGRIAIATRNYTSELEEAYDFFYRKTFQEKDKDWVEAAIKGIDYIIRGKIN